MPIAVEEHSLRLLLEKVRDYAILTLDPSGCVTSWNPAAERMKGYTEDEIIGKHFSIFFVDDDIQAGVPDRLLMEAAKSGTFSGEGRRRRKSGEVFQTEVEIVPLRDSDGTLKGFAKVVRDITDRVQMQDQLRQVNQDLNRFTAIASHDLHEPLRMVSMHLERVAVMAMDRIDEPTREHLECAVDGAKRMQALITSLLRLAHVGRDTLHLSEVSAESALSEAKTNLAMRSAETGGTITNEPLPVVAADHVLLVELLQNLVLNALKYHREGVPPDIHVSADVGENCWIFKVSDNGVGIKPEDQERVFAVFQRANAKPGSGLGLAICKRVVDRHGGRIWVESSPGVGSAFYFTLQRVSGG